MYLVYDHVYPGTIATSPPSSLFIKSLCKISEETDIPTPDAENPSVITSPDVVPEETSVDLLTADTENPSVITSPDDVSSGTSVDLLTADTENSSLTPFERLYYRSIYPDPKHKPKNPSRLRFYMNADEICLINQINNNPDSLFDASDSYFYGYDWMNQDNQNIDDGISWTYQGNALDPSKEFQF